jgi:hypothetical protein
MQQLYIPASRYFRSMVADAAERSDATSPPRPSSAARACLERVSLSSLAQGWLALPGVSG